MAESKTNPAQHLVHALQAQRNRALDEAAELAAALNGMGAEIAALKQQLAQAHAQIETLHTRLIPGEGGQS